MRPFSAPFPRFRRCQRGATLIEFSIIASALFLLCLGIIEMGLLFFAFTALEGATGIAARTGKTGFTTGGLSREAHIRSEIERLSSGILDSSALDIGMCAYGTFGDLTNPASVCTPGPGLPGQVVVYTVTYPWRMFTPLIGGLVADENGIVTLSASTTVRNEDF